MHDGQNGRHRTNSLPKMNSMSRTFRNEHCLITMSCVMLVSFVLPAKSAEPVDLRAQRAELIKTCTHSADEPCPHGRTWHVDNRADNASDDNDGTEKAPFASINKAAQLALPGDTVLVGAGAYREHVSPAQGGQDERHLITYAARDRQQVIIKGSEVWQPEWREVKLEDARNVWQAELDPALFTYDFPIENFNPFILSPLKIYMTTVEEYYAPVRPFEVGTKIARSPKRKRLPQGLLPVTRGSVFLAGRALRQITDPAQFAWVSNVFLVTADGNSVMVRLRDNQSPQGLPMEIVVREQVFAPRELGLSFVRASGFTFEHAANGNGVPQMGMVSASGGKGWVFEDCDFRWAGTAGLDVGRGAWYDLPGRGRAAQGSSGPDFDMIVRRSSFTDNGTAGLWCYSHGRSILVEDCVFERNNWIGRITFEEAGLKCHGVRNSVFRNNLFRYNDAYGLWLDLAGGNNRITGNLFMRNMNAGVYIEAVSGTTLVDNNISAHTRPMTQSIFTSSDGFHNQQSANVIFAHNLAYANAGYGFRCLLVAAIKANTFDRKPCKVSHNRLLNNISYANTRGAVSLPVDQNLCWGNRSAGNLFWGVGDPPLFDLGRGTLKTAGLVDLIEKTMAQHNIPPQEAPWLNRWKSGELDLRRGDRGFNGPLVGLPVWQAVGGYDTDAVVGPLPALRIYADGRLTVRSKPKKASAAFADLNDVKCARLPYVDTDYFGRPRPNDAEPTVGPIQDLTRLAGGDDELTIELWPNTSPNRRPASDMRIDIAPLPVTRTDVAEE